MLSSRCAYGNANAPQPSCVLSASSVDALERILGFYTIRMFILTLEVGYVEVGYVEEEMCGAAVQFPGTVCWL